MEEFKKPVVKGPVDANIFAVMGAASRALKRAGLADKAEEMRSRVWSTKSYEDALGVIVIEEYVEFDL